MNNNFAKPSRRAAVAVLSLVLLTGAEFYDARVAASGPPPATVLFVGNSFIRGIRRHLKKLFRHAGHYSRIKGTAPNGWHLADHTTSTRTYRRMSQLNWDLIIFQEHSDGLNDQSYPHVRFLHSRAQVLGADTMLFMVWRDRGEDVASYDNLLGTPGGNVGHLPIALELGIPIAPIGWAIRNAVTEGPPFDLWKDGHHLNGRGRYLEGCVFYAALTGESPVGGWAPGSLSDYEALYLQQLAADTVLTSPEDWLLEF